MTCAASSLQVGRGNAVSCPPCPRPANGRSVVDHHLVVPGVNAVSSSGVRVRPLRRSSAISRKKASRAMPGAKRIRKEASLVTVVAEAVRPPRGQCESPGPNGVHDPAW